MPSKTLINTLNGVEIVEWKVQYEEAPIRDDVIIKFSLKLYLQESFGGAFEVV